jgi:hypothetical protein
MGTTGLAGSVQRPGHPKAPKGWPWPESGAGAAAVGLASGRQARALLLFNCAVAVGPGQVTAHHPLGRARARAAAPRARAAHGQARRPRQPATGRLWPAAAGHRTPVACGGVDPAERVDGQGRRHPSWRAPAILSLCVSPSDSR